MKDLRQINRQFEIDIMELSSIVHSPGLLFKSELCLGVQFKPDKDVYQFTFQPGTDYLLNGLEFHLKTSGWKELKYVAIGYVKDNQFIHIKAHHVPQEQWFNLGFSHYDISFRLQNQWNNFPPCAFEQIKIYIKGTPHQDKPVLEIGKCCVWLEDYAFKEHNLQSSPNHLLVDKIKEYWRLCYPEYIKQGWEYYNNGKFPVGSYPVMTNTIPWDLECYKPVNQYDSTTYRYSWHALNSVSVLLLAAEEESLDTLLFGARDLINIWLDGSFYTTDADQKYCWYDHGTAERTLVLLVMWQLGLMQRFDYRFLNRCRQVLIQHARLLASEAFYACHQRTRYHNHAWFQDIALIACGIAFQGIDGADEWIATGERRLADQLNHLIVRDGSYAVFTENSIGYHQGVQRLAGFAAELLLLAGKESEIPEIAAELDQWTTDYRYPDGRFPAQGDTFRKPNPLLRQTIQQQAWHASSILLKRAGYLLVRGGDVSQPWMMTMIASNLNATHKHQDDLALTLWFDGVEWLLDPSFYSHEYTKPLPGFLRSASAHNLLYVPSAAYSISPAPGRVEVDLLSQGDTHRMIGVNRSCEGFSITRQLDFNPQELHPSLTVSDSFKVDQAGLEDSTGILGFHFGDGVNAQPDPDRGHTLLLSHPASKYQLVLSFSELTVSECLVSASTGMSFMEHSATVGLKIKVRPEQVVQWSLTVRQNND